MRQLPLLIGAGLLAACGETASTSGDEAGAAVSEAAPAATTNASSGSGDRAVPAVAASDAAANTASAEARETPEAQAQGIATLPLKRGFYVASDTSCEQASNATLMLVRRDGINTSRVPCEFKKIEKVGADSYRVTESCSEGGPAWGSEEHVSTNVSTYEIASETA